MIESIASNIKNKLPGIKSAIDAPINELGNWHLDISYRDRFAIVEWHPGRGFYLVVGAESELAGGVICEIPSEHYVDPDEVVSRLLKLFVSGGRTAS